MLGAKKGLNIKVAIYIEPDDDGSYHAYCPALKGLHVSGKTIEEARENARHGVMAYIASLVKHGDPLPIGIIEECREAEGSRERREFIEEMEYSPA